MGDDITIGVTEIVNNIEVTAQPNDQIIDISVVDNTDEVTLNITPTVIEINVNKGSSYAKWGTILGTLSDQEDLQDALDLKADLVDGKVPSSQLPSYVDDVIEVANYAALPTAGETGKIYITLDDNHIYRWTGSTYVEITDNTAVWGAITGTLSSQTDLQNALNAKAPTARTLTINGTSYDLSADRSWTVPTHDAVTIGTANGLSLSTQVLSLGLASSSTTGALSATDWNKFNSNTPAGTPNAGDYVFYNGSNLAYKTFLATTPLSVNTSTGTFSISQSGASTDGYLSSTDWNTFNSKLSSLSGAVLTTTDQTIEGNKTFSGYTELNDDGIYSSSFALTIDTIIADAINIKDNGVSKLQIGRDGEILAQKFVKDGGTSSQFLMADGSVSTGSTGISGSGTTGKIPLFTGSTAIGNSSLTEFPYYVYLNKPLDISHSTTTSGSAMNLSINNPNSTGPTLYAYNAGTGNLMQLQKSNNTPALVVDASGYVGIGVGSSLNRTLQVVGSTAISHKNTFSSLEILMGQYDSSGNAAINNVANADLWIGTNNTKVINIKANGYVGIGTGTTSPAYKLDIFETATGAPCIGLKSTNAAGYSGVHFLNASGALEGHMGFGNSGTGALANLFYFGSIASRAVVITTNDSEKIRITSGGEVNVGCQTTAGAGTTTQGVSLGNGGYITALRAGATCGYFGRTNAGELFAFFNNTTQVGSISIGASSTSYNTSSDYRLKEDLQPMVGALERLQQLKPVNFAWKSSGERVDGFIAHELAEVIPEAVTGEKDATEEVEVTPAVLDEEGNIIEEAVFETKDVYQGIDQSKIVPLLVAAMQEQNKVLEQLKAEIELLKAK